MIWAFREWGLRQRSWIRMRTEQAEKAVVMVVKVLAYRILSRPTRRLSSRHSLGLIPMQLYTASAASVDHNKLFESYHVDRWLDMGFMAMNYRECKVSMLTDSALFRLLAYQMEA